MRVVCSNTALHECVLRDNCRTTAVLFSGLKQDGTLDIWGIRADPNLRNSEGCVRTTGRCAVGRTNGLRGGLCLKG